MYIHPTMGGLLPTRQKSTFDSRLLDIPLLTYWLSLVHSVSLNVFTILLRESLSQFPRPNFVQEWVYICSNLTSSLPVRDRLLPPWEKVVQLLRANPLLWLNSCILLHGASLKYVVVWYTLVSLMFSPLFKKRKQSVLGHSNLTESGLIA